jgi:beta-phosphoglucomutase-like phosphatase (HAD superfamily)
MRADVIFDLDGTLIESEQIWRDVRHEFVMANGGQWRPDAAAAMIGMRTSEWARYLHDDLGVAVAPEQIAERVVTAVAQRLAKPPVLPGADAALHRLARDFRLGLASSAASRRANRARGNRLGRAVCRRRLGRRSCAR